ncbi:hypothetical protein [Duncaniella muris]|jgi:hypothetical protein|uniref:hypothetical protein n=1 Tax=Duncaniella muris TaxID=2094150 RepID=UPI0026774682|nr:hypothetical protein [Duncaniella muris]
MATGITSQKEIETRRKWIEGWNRTMISIWKERIDLLDVKDTEKLYKSLALVEFAVDPDGRLLGFHIKFEYTEYGLWQDLGTGREFTHDNGGDLPFLNADYRETHGLDKPKKRGPAWGGGFTSGLPRARRRWFSTKYYTSVMSLKNFMAESIGDEFKALFTSLDAEDYRYNTEYYKKKGWG